MKQILALIGVFIITTFLFVTLALFLGNTELITNTILGEYSSNYKIAIVQGVYGSSTGIVLIIATLTGINVALLVKRLIMLRTFGKIHLVIGGSIGLGLISSGCAACGLPLLAFLGISGSLTFLPFGGEEFPWITIALLLISGIILLKDIQRPPECAIKKN
jgi:hypothetical protein